MARRLVVFGVVVLALALGGLRWGVQHFMDSATANPAFFEEAIVAFEEADRAKTPAPGAILFVGSSSIRYWDDLDGDMAPLRVVNRGFGGAQFSHVLHNLERVIVPHAPRAVVVYAGDNDLAEGTGKDAARVFADYQAFVAGVRAHFPDLPIYFLAIKPSLQRWARWPVMRRANAQVEAWSAENEGLGYLDVAAPLLGADGEPRDEFFVFDGLHLSDAGYAAWAGVVRPRLLDDLGPGN